MSSIKNIIKRIFVIRDKSMMDGDSDSPCTNCSRFTSCENCPYS